MALPITEYVTVDDKDWAKPSKFKAATWDDINAICPRDIGGVCAGTLNGFDMDGWTWASLSETRMMLEYGFIDTSEWDSNLGLDNAGVAAIIAAFGSTTQNSSTSAISAWSRDIHEINNSIQGYTKWVTIKDCKVSACDYDYVGRRSAPKSIASGSLGGWFYRETTEVPEPPAIAFFGLAALAFLRISQREKHSDKDPKTC